MPDVPAAQPPVRPLSLLVAAGLTAVAAAFMAVVGVESVLANPGPLSAGIAAVLALWALFLAWASRGMFLGRRWSRGPVVAAGLLHLASFANFVGSQPLAVIPAAVALVTVGAARRPATTRALGLERPDA